MTISRQTSLNHHQFCNPFAIRWIALILTGCMPSHDTSSNNENTTSNTATCAESFQTEVFRDRVFLSEIDSLGHTKLSVSDFGDVDTDGWYLAKETVSKDRKFACRVYYRKESDTFKLALAQYFQNGTSSEISLAQDKAIARFVWSNWYETKIGPFLALLVAPNPHNEYLMVVSPDSRGTDLQARFHYFSPPHASPLLEHTHIDKETVCITDDCILSYDVSWSPQKRGVSKNEHLTIPLVVGIEALKY